MIGAVTLEVVDWWGRIDFVQAKAAELLPSLLKPVVQFAFSDFGRVSTIVLGFCLLAWASFRASRTATPIGDLRKDLSDARVPGNFVATAPSPSLAPEREFVDVTPEELMQMCHEHMDIQAQRLVQPYKGKWMKVSGRINNIRSSSDESAQVTFIRDTGGLIRDFYMYFKGTKWVERLAVLTRGNSVVVIGKITEISGICVTLQDCEIAS